MCNCLHTIRDHWSHNFPLKEKGKKCYGILIPPLDQLFNCTKFYTERKYFNIHFKWENKWIYQSLWKTCYFSTAFLMRGENIARVVFLKKSFLLNHRISLFFRWATFQKRNLFCLTRVHTNVLLFNYKWVQNRS